MPSIKSVIISCAGVGSRLGLAKTKALINIEGKPLIAWQLEYFKNVEDLRIVVGFQSKDVICEVLKYRKDVTFVYNHSYFENKTGTSFYMGARHAGEYVMEYDGDLIMHPDDARLCLETQGEYIAYSDKTSDEAVYVKTNPAGDVTAFSREEGDYEWTGPACIKRDKVRYSKENVFNILEEFLPMRGLKVRACDIDTYADYERAAKFIKKWFGL